jgi:ABC-type polysaccharide/polyol phosphate export permease
MTGREVVARGVAAVVMPIGIVVMYLVVTSAMVAIGYGPGTRFLSDMASGGNTAVENAAAMVSLNRFVILPLLIIVVAMVTARSEAAGAGILTAAVAAGVVGGYPSLRFITLLALMYVTVAYGVRFLRRRRTIVRT